MINFPIQGTKAFEQEETLDIILIELYLHALSLHLSHLILTTTECDWCYYYPHFTEEETEA